MILLTVSPGILIGFLAEAILVIALSVCLLAIAIRAHKVKRLEKEEGLRTLPPILVRPYCVKSEGLNKSAVVDQGAMAEVTSDNKNADGYTNVTSCRRFPCRHFHDQIFKTLDEAAIYFVERYNASSINLRREYGAYIAKFGNGN